MTRIRPFRSAFDSAGAAGGAAAAATLGSQNDTVVPIPSVLSTEISPPWRRMVP